MTATETKTVLQAGDIMFYEVDGGNIHFLRSGNRVIERTQDDHKYYVGQLSPPELMVWAKIFANIAGLKCREIQHHHPSNICYEFF